MVRCSRCGDLVPSTEWSSHIPCPGKSSPVRTVPTESTGWGSVVLTPGHLHRDPAPPFDGDTYDPALDGVRLGTLLADVRAVMSDGQWMTVTEVRDKIGRGTETSVSARIRDLRKRKFGGHTVESRRRGNHRDGLWEYRLTLRGTREPETH